MKDGLIGSLLNVIAMKRSGHKNPHIPQDAMNFFIATHSLSPRTFNMVLACLLGPCCRTFSCNNAKSERLPVICIEDKDMEARLLHHLQRLPGFGLRQLAISIGFDATK
eukprot:6585087-Ditylum_brightwellii.AAC.1